MNSYKRLFSRALAAAPGRLHFCAHSHHLWPDASYEGHLEAWDDAARLSDCKWERIFGEVIPEGCAHVARELNLPDPNTIAFAPSTHELLVRLFSAKTGGGPLDVLTTDGEFHSFRRQSGRWEEDGRIRRRVVACEPFETFSARFLAAFKERTPDIAFLSAVMFRTGLRFDNAFELASHARHDGPWVVIDLYHSFMALPCDFSGVADKAFLLGGGYKYAMAGEGVAYIHAPAGFAERPSNTGWFAEFSKLEAKQGAVEYSRDGMRFMGATFDPSGLYRFNAAMKWRAEVGLTTEKNRAHAHALQRSFVSKLEGLPISEDQLVVPLSNSARGQFLTFRTPEANVLSATLKLHRVITDARGDRLRFGFGPYQDEADLTELHARLRRVLR